MKGGKKGEPDSDIKKKRTIEKAVRGENDALKHDSM